MSGIIRHPERWIGALVIIAIVFVLMFALSIFAGDEAKHSTNHPPYPYDVKVLEDLGRDHIPEGQIFDGYNSSPPTSGPHGPVLPWGVQDLPVPKERAVHNMEHGGVVVWYDCTGGEKQDAESCTRLRDQLAAIVRPAVEEGMFILMTPYTGIENENSIALTAWQHLDAFSKFDAVRVQAFIASFECKFNEEGFC